MSFDAPSLLLSFLFGSIGFVGFVYGKRQSRAVHMIAGGLLMAYPYFVPNLWLMGGIGLGIVALWISAVRLGA
ncbi:MAG: amino acid transport protein [Deltaproteobacteria bacterium]|nr:MAG: amino acid transport protein [Deltaproteobacteria bacterium]